MKLGLAIAAVTLTLCAGCGDNQQGAGTTAEIEQEPMEESATPAGDDALTPPPAGAPSGGAPPPPELAPVYSAKITKVDISSSDKNRYDVEVIFTSAQGRSFKAIVSTDGGTLISEENIPEVPDAYYAHVFSFNHTGDVSDVNVQVIAPDEKSVLDKWDL